MARRRQNEHSDMRKGPVFCQWLTTVGADDRRDLGAVSIRKTVLPGMAIPILKMEIFNMEIAIRR